MQMKKVHNAIVHAVHSSLHTLSSSAWNIVVVTMLSALQLMPQHGNSISLAITSALVITALTIIFHALHDEEE